MIQAVFAAFALLTRVPVPARFSTGADLGRAVGFFPLVGLLLGLGAMGMAAGLAGHLPPAVAATGVVALLAAVTGALHLDGVADLFDGLAGGRGDRARVLDIMRDSRIGSAGAVAVVLVLAAKIAAIAALIDARDFLPLLVSPVVARWAVTPQVVLFPTARAEGLGHGFRAGARGRDLAIATVLLAAVGFASGGAIIVQQAAASLFVSLVIGVWLRVRLGGLTGDVYGATIEIAEVLALSVALLS
ncbi:MAG: adenosylcobinamide-GDP ribazoletransferase [Verrucomicrobiota bacterium]